MTARITDEMLSQVQRDLQMGRPPLDRLQFADCQAPRLRIIVHKDGPVKYRLWKDGDPIFIPASSVAEARQLALSV